MKIIKKYSNEIRAIKGVIIYFLLTLLFIGLDIESYNLHHSLLITIALMVFTTNMTCDYAEMKYHISETFSKWG